MSETPQPAPSPAGLRWVIVAAGTGGIMTKPPETHIEQAAAAAPHRDRLLPPARYRHPGDVIRLIIAGFVLAGALAVTAAADATYAGASATAVSAVAPSTLAGRVLAGLVQAVFVAGAAVAVVITLRYRRYRLLLGLAGSAVLASAVVIGILELAGGQRPRALAAGAGPWPWLTGGSLLGPALGAAVVAAVVAAAPWLARAWRRAAWITLWLAAGVRLITGTASPAEVVLAFAAGVTAGAAALVVFGVPDRRAGPAEIAAALGSAGLPVVRVDPAAVAAKGSRPFTAATEDGRPLFIKVLGADQRDTDLGADRAVAAATAVIGPDGVAAAVPLLQPLALSAGTRRAIARQDGLLTQTRQAAAAACGCGDTELARVQRVRPRTLLAIAAVAGAYYYLLPSLAKVPSSWQAVQSADWAWVPLVIALSVVTYLASAVALMGAVSQRIRLWPTFLAQGASSFINRVSPANVGGMALNARFLQKSGVEPTAGVAAVGVNSLVGAVVHLILIVIFFAWSSRRIGQAFKLPATSTLLAILAAVLAVIGIVLATRPGRRFASGTLVPKLRSAAASLSRVARNPGKMTMLFGGSALITLAYIGALAASVQAFGGGPGFIVIGAVYLGTATVAAATPTPGGIGGFEAAAIVGLTGVGMANGPAVSAVLLYRLATYWLPVAPGWLAWRVLQRRGYV
jgi:uncharacterized membrane protein YbhN (UPF0104 family)